MNYQSHNYLDAIKPWRYNSGMYKSNFTTILCFFISALYMNLCYSNASRVLSANLNLCLFVCMFSSKN